jgi:hypothetical protein
MVLGQKWRGVSAKWFLYPNYRTISLDARLQKIFHVVGHSGHNRTCRELYRINDVFAPQINGTRTSNPLFGLNMQPLTQYLPALSNVGFRSSQLKVVNIDSKHE